jgi:hypothetical protein
MSNKPRKIAFDEALEGAKRTISSLEDLSGILSRHDEVTSAEDKSESDLNDRQKILDDLLAKLEITEKQGKELVDIGDEFKIDGRSPESVAQRWQKISFHHSKKQEVQFLSQQWAQKRDAEGEIEQVNCQSVNLKSRLNECGKLEEKLAICEQRNKKIDEKRAQVKGVRDWVRTNILEFERKGDSESLRARIWLLDRSRTQQQVNDLTNRKATLNQAIASIKKSILGALGQLQIAPDAMSGSLVLQLEDDLRVAARVPEDLGRHLGQYSLLSQAFTYRNEADEYRSRAFENLCEHDDQLAATKRRCQDLLEENWFGQLTNCAAKRFNLSLENLGSREAEDVTGRERPKIESEQRMDAATAGDSYEHRGKHKTLEEHWALHFRRMVFERGPIDWASKLNPNDLLSLERELVILHELPDPNVGSRGKMNTGDQHREFRAKNTGCRMTYKVLGERISIVSLDTNEAFHKKRHGK